MHNLQGDWEELTFELGPWKETGTYILKGGPVEEAQTLLDDHIVKSQAMAASPFAKPFAERLVPWERKLVRFQVPSCWLLQSPQRPSSPPLHLRTAREPCVAFPQSLADLHCTHFNSSGRGSACTADRPLHLCRTFWTSGSSARASGCTWSQSLGRRRS